VRERSGPGGAARGAVPQRAAAPQGGRHQPLAVGVRLAIRDPAGLRIAVRIPERVRLGLGVIVAERVINVSTAVQLAASYAEQPAAVT
jgi:hypothetical protein